MATSGPSIPLQTEVVELGERIKTERRTAVQTKKTGNDHASIVVNITEDGSREHDIRPGDEVNVHVHEGGIAIEPAENGENGQR